TGTGTGGGYPYPDCAVAGAGCGYPYAGWQVGTVSPARRASRTYADRLALALDLLADPALDALVTGECAFDELPDVLPRLASGEIPALCHRVRYEDPA
ncbi:hypothetical protein ACWDPP_23510, partial [Streptomyces sp. NPDC000851]